MPKLILQIQHFEWTKLIKNAKNGQTSDFWNPKTSGQTVFPDSSILIEQKLVENAINCKIKYTEWTKVD